MNLCFEPYVIEKEEVLCARDSHKAYLAWPQDELDLLFLEQPGGGDHHLHPQPIAHTPAQFLSPSLCSSRR